MEANFGGSFIQLDSQVAHSVFVQLSSALESNDPIMRVQKSLLATAEMSGNKQLAVFATSLAQTAAEAGAGGALDKVIALVKDMIADLQKQVDLEHKGSWCEVQQESV